ncbi:MAG: hypothetical protein Q4G30_03230 [Actinomycetaceae bacterium]|nr:hypothetical protein [Actinomycetaceae bacterium]
MKTKRGGGRPRVLTEEQIGQAVKEVGWTDLTFRAISSKLKVGATTLFRYAPNRDALSRMGMDAVLKDVKWPKAQDSWKETMRSWAMTAWDVFAQYPGVAHDYEQGIISPKMSIVAAEAAYYLVSKGFTTTQAALIVNSVFDLVASKRSMADFFERESSLFSDLKTLNSNILLDHEIPEEFKEEFTEVFVNAFSSRADRATTESILNVILEGCEKCYSREV